MNDITEIVDDFACIHCGYNLHRLKHDGKCPECFTPIRLSLRGNLLSAADPNWLDTLRFGTVLKLWNLVVGFVVGMAAGVMVWLSLPQELFAVLGFVAGTFGLWAAIVITTQEPRISLREDPVTWRKVIRVCAAISLLAGTAKFAGQDSSYAHTIWLASSILSLLCLLGMFGELLYFSRFAERIPDHKLARNTRIVMWGATIILALASCLELAKQFVGPGPPSNALQIIVAGTACVVILPGLVFFVWYVVLLFRYKKVFMVAARASRGPDHQADETSPT